VKEIYDLQGSDTSDIEGNENNLEMEIGGNDEDMREIMLSSTEDEMQITNDNHPVNPPRSKKPHKKHVCLLTVVQKLDIVAEALECKNIRATARKYGVHDKSIHHWIKNMKSMEEKAQTNPTARTCGVGAQVNPEKRELERRLCAWIEEQINIGVAVRTNHIFDKAIEYDPSFNRGDDEKIQSAWMYAFLQRYKMRISDRSKNKLDLISSPRKAGRDHA
jgi:transposase-like protein